MYISNTKQTIFVLKAPIGMVYNEIQRTAAFNFTLKLLPLLYMIEKNMPVVLTYTSGEVNME